MDRAISRRAIFGRLSDHRTLIVGFSVETENLVQNSREKLLRKKLDFIIANNPKQAGSGFAADTNQVEIISEKETYTVPLMSKKETAHKIIDYILKKKKQ